MKNPGDIQVVDDVTVVLSRQKTPAELIALTSRMFSAARDRLREYLRQEHPEWNDAEVHSELIRRIHGAR
jgi:hypothetical protein